MARDLDPVVATFGRGVRKLRERRRGVARDGRGTRLEPDLGLRHDDVHPVHAVLPGREVQRRIKPAVVADRHLVGDARAQPVGQLPRRPFGRLARPRRAGQPHEVRRHLDRAVVQIRHRLDRRHDAHGPAGRRLRIDQQAAFHRPEPRAGQAFDGLAHRLVGDAAAQRDAGGHAGRRELGRAGLGGLGFGRGVNGGQGKDRRQRALQAAGGAVVLVGGDAGRRGQAHLRVRELDRARVQRPQRGDPGHGGVAPGGRGHAERQRAIRALGDASRAGRVEDAAARVLGIRGAGFQPGAVRVLDHPQRKGGDDGARGRDAGRQRHAFGSVAVKRRGKPRLFRLAIRDRRHVHLARRHRHLGPVRDRDRGDAEAQRRVPVIRGGLV